jgi:hypothetical protein
MMLLWPLLLVAAAILGWRRRGDGGHRGWRWFTGWVVAGFLISFSLVAGLSIGLVVLPLAAIALLTAAAQAPHLREASGFVVGVATTVALIVALNA